MTRRCPYCSSVNVRRSGRLESEASTHPFHSPYRCRDCEQRFWVVSRKTLFGAVAGVAALAISVMVWSGIGVLEHRDTPARPTVSSPPNLRSDAGPAVDGHVLSDVLLRQFGTRLDGLPPTSPAR